MPFPPPFLHGWHMDLFPARPVLILKDDDMVAALPEARLLYNHLVATARMREHGRSRLSEMCSNCGYQLF